MMTPEQLEAIGEALVEAGNKMITIGKASTDDYDDADALVNAASVIEDQRASLEAM